MVQLPIRNGHGRASNKDALRALGEYAHAVGDALLELVGELVGLLRAAGGVVEEGDLGHEQAIFTRNGNAVFGLRGIEHAGERTTLLVGKLDCRGEVFRRQLIAGEFFHHLREVSDFISPFVDVFRALHLRNVHHIRALVGA